VLLATGWTAEAVAEVLQVDANTVRNHFKRYRQDGLKALGHTAFHGSACLLDEDQLARLDLHLQKHLYLSAKAVAHWVEKAFGVSYTESGRAALLRRLDYVYKKPKLIPGKADPAAQKAHLEAYKKLKENKGEDDPIYFYGCYLSSANPVLAYSGIKCGEDCHIPSNTGRRRVNISGVIDLERLEPIARFDDTINADSTIALFKQIEELNPAAAAIHVICDNARGARLPFQSRNYSGPLAKK